MKKFEKNKVTILFYIFLFLVLNISVFPVEAKNDFDPFWDGSNEPVWNDYGIVKCWFSKDNKNWDEATVNYIELKIGQPFFIKAMIKPLQGVQMMSLRLSGLGLNPDFELIQGPSDLEETFLIKNPKINETRVYVWKFYVKHNTTWVNANSPITMDSCFKDVDMSCLPPFTVVNIFILDEIWVDYLDDITALNVNNSDLKIVYFFLCLFLVVYYKMKAFY